MHQKRLQVFHELAVPRSPANDLPFATTMSNVSNLSTAVYLDEYTRDDIIARYISQSAGAGIAYVLTHVYGPIYRRLIKDLISRSPRDHQFRVLEYECGG